MRKQILFTDPSLYSSSENSIMSRQFNSTWCLTAQREWILNLISCAWIQKWWWQTKHVYWWGTMLVSVIYGLSQKQTCSNLIAIVSLKTLIWLRLLFNLYNSHVHIFNLGAWRWMTLFGLMNETKKKLPVLTGLITIRQYCKSHFRKKTCRYRLIWVWINEDRILTLK